MPTSSPPPLKFSSRSRNRRRAPRWPSIDSPQIGRQNVQLRTILGHGPPGDDDFFLGQQLDDGFVGQRAGGFFLLNQFGDDVLDARIGHVGAAGGRIAGGEEKFHLEQALRRLHIFAGHGPAHGGFMDAHHGRHLHHGQRLQVGDPVFQKIALPFYNLIGDVQNRLLPLVQALDQEFSRADFA